MSRIIGAAVLFVALSVMPVFAQQAPSPMVRPVMFSAMNAMPAVQPAAFSFAEAAAPAAPAASSPLTLPTPVERRMTSINLLCVSFAALQAFDLHSTFSAFKSGATEANPMLTGMAGNKGAMIGFKAAMTGGTIYLVQKFGVKNRTAATVLMVVANSAYGMIAAHNYRVARARR